VWHGLKFQVFPLIGVISIATTEQMYHVVTQLS